MANPSHHATADSSAIRGNGQVPAARSLDIAAARPPGPSTRPAALVLGIIVVIFVLGAVAAGLSGGVRSGTRSPAPTSAVVPGTGGLVAVPARQVLNPVLTPDEPPADVVAALVVPRASVSIPGTAVERGLGLYDGEERVQVPASEQGVIAFYRAELAAGRWHVLRAGPAAGDGYEFLAQHPGSDGYEWELGLTMSPTGFDSQVAGVTIPAGGATPMSVRLFAESDDS